MIAGLGVDLCSISRMEKAVRSAYFVQRIFRPPEIAYARGKGKENLRAQAASFASAFAAREAFAKASGVSIYKVALSVYLERTNGVPSLVFPSEADFAADFAEGRKRAWVSLSHDGDYAVAAVVIEAFRNGVGVS
ncbi:MAG: 4'-phosphopantetheinyl transferase superfamily protein [Synergistaceae bacterium]|jgi:holo-[acyl-carrier protein] synthase|nr:4'-phosphopantetheinyl transferase superfamily protein [Synergistaceae bacterium]